MREWWLDLSPRDRLVLLAGGVTIGLLLFWVWLVQPMRETRQDLEQRLIQMQQEYEWLAARAPEVAVRRQALQGTRNPSSRASDGASLLGIVDVSARAAGLGGALQRVRPLERAVEVEFEASIYTDLMRWLANLEQGHGVRVVTLGLDRTETSGRVNARLRLEPAGR